jgi:hypothetical protein
MKNENPQNLFLVIKEIKNKKQREKRSLNPFENIIMILSLEIVRVIIKRTFLNNKVVF